MRAVHLRTDHLIEPLGLGNSRPRFYWQCEGDIRQTAYQIIAKRDGETIWDSGKVLSSTMTHIPYEGETLRSRDRVSWSVTLWDENNIPDETTCACYEMGLLNKSDWTAKWISGGYKPKKNIRYPADCFLKCFNVKKKVLRARLYITALGLYEAELNGQRIGDFVLAPGCTDYRKRVQYQTYDVTALLNSGDNTLEIMLGDGWFCGSLGAFGKTYVYGRQPKIFCQLEITYADGSTDKIASDDSFLWSNDGPIRFNDLQDGEVYNAAMRPSYSRKAVVVTENRVLVSGDNVYPKEQERLSAELIVTPSGKRVLDFGQNIAGFLEFHIQGAKGQRVRLLLGETLDEDGNFTQLNFQNKKPVKEFGQAKEIMMILGMGDKIKNTQPTPKQEIVLTCSGEEDFYKTKFAVFGFRYALVETDMEINPADFTAVAVYSDMEQVGGFSCSNEKVNRLVENTRWSMKGNYLDIPIDCPTRERLGWTGDAQVFFNTAAYFMDVAPFFAKWMQDMADGVMKNGVVPSVVPYVSFDLMYNNTAVSVGWADAAVLLPYRYWKRYGDREMMEKFYDLMARPYAMFAISNTGHADKKEAKADPLNEYVYEKGRHLGEWLEPEEFNDKIGAGSQLKQIEVATAYFHYSMSLMEEMARELGRTDDKALFADYAEGSKKAYAEMFLKNGAPDTDRQAKLVRPLALGLTKGDVLLTEALQKRLCKAVENRKYRIGTGFLSTPFILPMLTKAGRNDLAYKMLECEEAPSWLYEVNKGATTIWETWEGFTGDPGSGSLNHYSPGAVCQWIFETVLGIQPDGENHFIIAPVPGGTLTHAEGSYRSIYGKVYSRWDVCDREIVYRITIPANCTAEIHLPSREVFSVSCGNYTWRCSK